MKTDYPLKRDLTMSIKSKIVTLTGSLIIGFSMIAMKAIEKKDVVKNAVITSVAWVESKGNPKAKSKDGSVGIIQIKPVMVKEVNRICKIQGIEQRYTLSDRLSPKKSEEMFWIYQEFYNPKVNWDSLSTKDIQSMVRKWNGGPKGDRIKGTAKYWNKVSKKFTQVLRDRDIISISKL